MQRYLFMQNDTSLPLYLRSEQIVRDRNHSLNAKKIEINRKNLIEEAKTISKFNSSDIKGDPNFFENMKNIVKKFESIFL